MILDELRRSPNVSSAARVLYMSQPTLTKRIQHMEQEFGVKIAERTPHGLKFTEEGKYLCQRAADYMAFDEKTHRNLEAIKRAGNNVITIGSSYMFNRYKLWDILGDYSKRDALANFDVVNDLSQNLFTLLTEDKIDIAFLRGVYDDERVEKILVERSRAYLVSSKPVTFDDLANMRRIDYRTSPHTANLIESWWQDQFGGKLPFGMMIGYLGFVWEPIATNPDYYTICFVPERFENVFNLCLQPLYKKDGSPLTRDSWCMYQKSKPVSNQLQLFIDYVKTNVALDSA